MARNASTWGRAPDGTVKLFESDNPEPVITTSAQKLLTFAEAVVGGEFNLQR